MLDTSSFSKSKQFMEDHARDLDLALFRYEFFQENKEDAVTALKKYQNGDGGFGRGLEPDVQLPNSSVLATTVALQYVNFLDLDPDHEIIVDALEYLLSAFVEDENYWPPVPLEVMDYPHAPWWNVEHLEPPELAFWPNPNVEVIGYLNRYDHHIPHEFLNSMNNILTSYLEEQQTIQGNLWYNFFCWKRAIPHLPKRLKEETFKMLDRTFDSPDVLDRDHLGHLSAGWLVTEPSSYLNQKYPQVIRSLLLEEINSMHEDGCWYPKWKWGDTSTWNDIRIEWAGKITVEMLSTLKYFDLIQY